MTISIPTLTGTNPGTNPNPCSSRTVMDLDFVIVMNARAVESNTSGATKYDSTQIPFDVSKYDGGATFTLVGEFVNNNATTDYKAYLVKYADDTVIDSINVPANTTVQIAIKNSAPFDASGLNETLALKIDQTTNNNDLQCHWFGIAVSQRDATRSRIPILFCYGFAINQQDLTFGSDRFTGGDTGYLVEDSSRIFLNTLAAYDVVDHLTFETIGACTGGTSDFYVTLRDRDTGTDVVENDHNSTSVTLVSTDFQPDDVNWIDGDFYEVYSRVVTSFFSNSILLAVRLWVELSSLNKVELYFPTKVVSTGKRMPITPGNFSGAVKIYHESCGYEDTAGTVRLGLFSADTAPTDSTETEVTGGDINYDDSNKVRVRSGELTLDSALKYYETHKVSGTGTLAELISDIVVSVDAT